MKLIFNPAQLLLKASFTSILARLATTIISLTIVGLVSRHLTVEDLATYWIFISVLSFITLIAQFGIGQIVVSEVSQALARQDDERSNSIIINATSLVFLLSFLCGLIASIFMKAGILDQKLQEIPLQIFILLLIGGVLCSLSILIVDILKAKMQLTLASCLAAQPASGGVVPSSIFLFLLFLIVSVQSSTLVSLIVVCLCFLLGWVALLIIGNLYLKINSQIMAKLRLITLSELRRLTLTSLPIAAAAVAMFLITQGDLWFVYYYMSYQDSAAYGIASNFVKYVSAINIMLGALLPGLVGHMWATQDISKLKYLLKRLAQIGTLAAFLIFLAIALYGDIILYLLVGSGYTAALTPLLILSFGHLINALMGYPQVLIITAGLRAQIFYASLVASLITLVGLRVFVPMFGLVGAASLSAIGLVVYGSIISVVCVRATGIHCHAFARN